MNTKLRNRILIVAGIILVAVLGSVFVNIGMEWFNSLRVPTQWIPNELIPIVWSVIYLTFAIILWRMESEGLIDKKLYVLIIINGILNVLWCLIFFTLNQTLGGLIFIIFNLIFAYVLVSEIFKKKYVYGLIVSIYPIWVSVATALNLALWILN
ncbi:MAG: tryptophan-rich sensory protein [Clostridiales bacterium]|nr:tryptophan-rich sensory protein [Clostridiales bacterium]